MTGQSWPLLAALATVLAAGPAVAGMTCADLDSDGVAETCIETDETGAHFPGEEPPDVPDPGEGVPVEPDEEEETPAEEEEPVEEEAE